LVGTIPAQKREPGIRTATTENARGLEDARLEDDRLRLIFTCPESTR
jgi:predicted RNA polymerase sigma factor